MAAASAARSEARRCPFRESSTVACATRAARGTSQRLSLWWSSCAPFINRPIPGDRKTSRSGGAAVRDATPSASTATAFMNTAFSRMLTFESIWMTRRSRSAPMIRVILRPSPTTRVTSRPSPTTRVTSRPSPTTRVTSRPSPITRVILRPSPTTRVTSRPSPTTQITPPHFLPRSA